MSSNNSQPKTPSTSTRQQNDSLRTSNLPIIGAPQQAVSKLQQHSTNKSTTQNNTNNNLSSPLAENNAKLPRSPLFSDAMSSPYSPNRQPAKEGPVAPLNRAEMMARLLQGYDDIDSKYNIMMKEAQDKTGGDVINKGENRGNAAMSSSSVITSFSSINLTMQPPGQQPSPSQQLQTSMTLDDYEFNQSNTNMNDDGVFTPGKQRKQHKIAILPGQFIFDGEHAIDTTLDSSVSRAYNSPIRDGRNLSLDYALGSLVSEQNQPNQQQNQPNQQQNQSFEQQFEDDLSSNQSSLFNSADFQNWMKQRHSTLDDIDADEDIKLSSLLSPLNLDQQNKEKSLKIETQPQEGQNAQYPPNLAPLDPEMTPDALDLEMEAELRKIQMSPFRTNKRLLVQTPLNQPSQQNPSNPSITTDIGINLTNNNHNMNDIKAQLPNDCDLDNVDNAHVNFPSFDDQILPSFSGSSSQTPLQFLPQPHQIGWMKYLSAALEQREEQEGEGESANNDPNSTTNGLNTTPNDNEEDPINPTENPIPTTHLDGPTTATLHGDVFSFKHNVPLHMDDIDEWALWDRYMQEVNELRSRKEQNERDYQGEGNQRNGNQNVDNLHNNGDKGNQNDEKNNTSPSSTPLTSPAPLLSTLSPDVQQAIVSTPHFLWSSLDTFVDDDEREKRLEAMYLGDFNEMGLPSDPKQPQDDNKQETKGAETTLPILDVVGDGKEQTQSSQQSSQSTQTPTLTPKSIQKPSETSKQPQMDPIFDITKNSVTMSDFLKFSTTPEGSKSPFPHVGYSSKLLDFCYSDSFKPIDLEAYEKERLLSQEKTLLSFQNEKQQNEQKMLREQQTVMFGPQNNPLLFPTSQSSPATNENKTKNDTKKSSNSPNSAKNDSNTLLTSDDSSILLSEADMNPFSIKSCGFDVKSSVPYPLFPGEGGRDAKEPDIDYYREMIGHMQAAQNRMFLKAPQGFDEVRPPVGNERSIERIVDGGADFGNEKNDQNNGENDQNNDENVQNDNKNDLKIPNNQNNSKTSTLATTQNKPTTTMTNKGSITKTITNPPPSEFNIVLTPSTQQLNAKTSLNTLLTSSIGDDHIYLTTTLPDRPVVTILPAEMPRVIPVDIIKNQHNIQLAPTPLTSAKIEMLEGKFASRMTVLNHRVVGIVEREGKEAKGRQVEEIKRRQNLIERDQNQQNSLQNYLPNSPNSPNCPNLGIGSLLFPDQYSKEQLTTLMHLITYHKRTKQWFFPFQAIQLAKTWESSKTNQNFFTTTHHFNNFFNNMTHNTNNTHDLPSPLTLFNHCGITGPQFPLFNSLPLLSTSDPLRYLQLLRAFMSPERFSFPELFGPSPTSIIPSIPPESLPLLFSQSSQFLTLYPILKPLNPSYFNALKRSYLQSFLNQFFYQSTTLHDLYFLSQAPITSSPNPLAPTDLYYATAINVPIQHAQVPTSSTIIELKNLLEDIPKPMQPACLALIQTLLPDLTPPKRNKDGKIIFSDPGESNHAISYPIQVLFNVVSKEFAQQQLNASNNSTNAMNNTTPPNDLTNTTSPFSLTNHVKSSLKPPNTLGESETSKTRYRTLIGGLIEEENNNDVDNIYYTMRATLTKSSNGLDSDNSDDSQSEDDGDDNKASESEEMVVRKKQKMLKNGIPDHNIKPITSFAIPACTCGRLRAFSKWFDRLYTMAQNRRNADGELVRNVDGSIPAILNIIELFSTSPAAITLLSLYLQCNCVISAFNLQFPGVYNITTPMATRYSNTNDMADLIKEFQRELKEKIQKEKDIKKKEEDEKDDEKNETDEKDEEKSNEDNNDNPPGDEYIPLIYSHPVHPNVPINFIQSIVSFPVHHEDYKELNQVLLSKSEEIDEKWQKNQNLIQSQRQQLQSGARLPPSEIIQPIPSMKEYGEQLQALERVIAVNTYLYSNALQISPLTGLATTSQQHLEQSIEDEIRRQGENEAYTLKQQKRMQSSDPLEKLLAQLPPPASQTKPILHTLPLTHISKIPLFSIPISTQTPKFDLDQLNNVVGIYPGRNVQLQPTETLLVEYIDPAFNYFANPVFDHIILENLSLSQRDVINRHITASPDDPELRRVLFPDGEMMGMGGEMSQYEQEPFQQEYQQDEYEQEQEYQQKDQQEENQQKDQQEEYQQGPLQEEFQQESLQQEDQQGYQQQDDQQQEYQEQNEYHEQEYQEQEHQHLSQQQLINQQQPQLITYSHSQASILLPTIDRYSNLDPITSIGLYNSTQELLNNYHHYIPSSTTSLIPRGNFSQTSFSSSSLISTNDDTRENRTQNTTVAPPPHLPPPSSSLIKPSHPKLLPIHRIHNQWLYPKINNSYVTYQGGFSVLWTLNNRNPLGLSLLPSPSSSEYDGVSLIPPESQLDVNGNIDLDKLDIEQQQRLDKKCIKEYFLTTNEKNLYLYQLSTHYNLLPPTIPLGTATSLTSHSSLSSDNKNLIDLCEINEKLTPAPIETEYDISLTLGTTTLPSVLTGLEKLIPLLIPNFDSTLLLSHFQNQFLPFCRKQQPGMILNRELSMVPGDTSDTLNESKDTNDAFNAITRRYGGRFVQVGRDLNRMGEEEYKRFVEGFHENDPYHTPDLLDAVLMQDSLHYSQQTEFTSLWLNAPIALYNETEIEEFYRRSEEYVDQVAENAMAMNQSFFNSQNETNFSNERNNNKNENFIPHPIHPMPYAELEPVLPFSLDELALLRTTHTHHPSYKYVLNDMKQRQKFTLELERKKNNQGNSSKNQKSKNTSDKKASKTALPSQLESNFESLEHYFLFRSTLPYKCIDESGIYQLQKAIPSLLCIISNILSSPLTTTSFSLLSTQERQMLFNAFQNPILGEMPPDLKIRQQNGGINRKTPVVHPHNDKITPFDPTLSTLAMAQFNVPIDQTQLRRSKDDGNLTNDSQWVSDEVINGFINKNSLLFTSSSSSSSNSSHSSYSPSPNPLHLISSVFAQFGSDYNLPSHLQNHFSALSGQFSQSLPISHRVPNHTTNLSSSTTSLSSPLAQIFALFGQNIGQYVWSMLDGLLNSGFTQFMMGQQMNRPFKPSTADETRPSLINVSGLYNDMKRSITQSIVVQNIPEIAPYFIPIMEDDQNDPNQQSRFTFFDLFNDILLPPENAVYPSLITNLEIAIGAHQRNTTNKLRALGIHQATMMREYYGAKNDPNVPHHILTDWTDYIHNDTSMARVEDLTGLHNPLHYFTMVNPAIVEFIHNNPYQKVINKKNKIALGKRDEELKRSAIIAKKAAAIRKRLRKQQNTTKPHPKAINLSDSDSDSDETDDALGGKVEDDSTTDEDDGDNAVDGRTEINLVEELNRLYTSQKRRTDREQRRRLRQDKVNAKSNVLSPGVKKFEALGSGNKTIKGELRGLPLPPEGFDTGIHSLPPSTRASYLTKITQQIKDDDEKVIDQNAAHQRKLARVIKKTQRDRNKNQIIVPQQLLYPILSPSFTAIEESFLATHFYNKYLPSFYTMLEQRRFEQIEDQDFSDIFSNPQYQKHQSLPPSPFRPFTTSLSRLDYISLVQRYRDPEVVEIPRGVIYEGDEGQQDDYFDPSTSFSTPHPTPQQQQTPCMARSLKYLDIRLALISPSHTKLYTLVDEAIKLLTRCLTTVKRIRTEGKGLPPMAYQMLKNWFETSCFNEIIHITSQLHYAVLNLWLSHLMLLSFDCVLEQKTGVFGLPPVDMIPKVTPQLPITIPAKTPDDLLLDLTGAYGVPIAPGNDAVPVDSTSSTVVGSNNDNNNDNNNTNSTVTIPTPIKPTPANRRERNKTSLIDPAPITTQFIGQQQSPADIKKVIQDQINRAQQIQNADELSFFNNLKTIQSQSADYFSGVTNPYAGSVQLLLQLGLISSAATRPSMVPSKPKL